MDETRDGVDGRRYSLGVAAVISDINSGAAKWLEAGRRSRMTMDDVVPT